MQKSLLLIVTVLFAYGLAVAQVCPAPSTSTGIAPAVTCPATCPATAGITYPATTGVTCSVPVAAAGTVCPVGMPVTGSTTLSPVCSTAGMTQDTSCILRELSALRADMRGVRGEIRAASLAVRGQDLATRLDQLIMSEMMLRQTLASNPNMPGAQVAAISLSNDANALYRDIAAYNRELSAIAPDIRPFMATRLSTFDTVYWQPTLAQLSNYSTNFAQYSTAYQPAFAANPWLQPWLTSYQCSLANLGTTPQAFASVRWWGTPQVLGSIEGLPATATTLPSNAVIYIPAATPATSAACPPVTTTTAACPPVATTTAACPAACPSVTTICPPTTVASAGTTTDNGNLPTGTEISPSY